MSEKRLLNHRVYPRQIVSLDFEVILHETRMETKD